MYASVVSNRFLGVPRVFEVRVLLAERGDCKSVEEATKLETRDENRDERCPMCGRADCGTRSGLRRPLFAEGPRGD